MHCCDASTNIYLSIYRSIYQSICLHTYIHTYIISIYLYTNTYTYFILSYFNSESHNYVKDQQDAFQTFPDISYLIYFFLYLISCMVYTQNSEGSQNERETVTSSAKNLTDVFQFMWRHSHKCKWNEIVYLLAEQMIQVMTPRDWGKIEQTYRMKEVKLWMIQVSGVLDRRKWACGEWEGGREGGREWGGWATVKKKAILVERFQCETVIIHWCARMWLFHLEQQLEHFTKSK